MTQTSLGVAQSNISTNPSRRISVVENHDEALPIWRNSAGAGRILVHVDAHHDMWWVPPGQDVTIANFISPALREGILREIYWVVPDHSWESVANRRQIFHHLHQILKKSPGSRTRVDVTRTHISTTLLGKSLRICSVEGLPKFEESVLLDVDIDYLILPRVKYGSGDLHPALPWQWPDELVDRLHSAGVQSDLVTIAYSVEGGFTPLRWKYLGDELKARFSGADSSILRGMRLMREGAEAAARGDFSAAEKAYFEAAGCLPGLAAPFWHIAFLYLDTGRAADAQRIYRCALNLDPSYRTAHNNMALWHYWSERWSECELECQRILALDPNDAYAHLELGWLALRRSKWNTAESEFGRAMETQPDLLDAHRSLGRVHQELGRRREAITEYEKSLKIALSGQESLQESPGVAAERPRLNDRCHFDVFLRLGELYLDLGEQDRAGRHLHMAAAGGLDGVVLRCRLALLAFQQKRWKTIGLELAKAWKQLAAQTGGGLLTLWRGVRRPFHGANELWRVR